MWSYCTLWFRFSFTLKSDFVHYGERSETNVDTCPLFITSLQPKPPLLAKRMKTNRLFYPALFVILCNCVTKKMKIKADLVESARNAAMVQGPAQCQLDFRQVGGIISVSMCAVNTAYGPVWVLDLCYLKHPRHRLTCPDTRWQQSTACPPCTSAWLRPTCYILIPWVHMQHFNALDSIFHMMSPKPVHNVAYCRSEFAPYCPTMYTMFIKMDTLRDL